MKANNKTKKLVKVTYEYLAPMFVETNKGCQTHTDDEGNIHYGQWRYEWYEGGSDEMPENEVADFIARWSNNHSRRNFRIQEI